MKGNFEQIISDSRPVIIDFHALWCEPCKVQSPILKEIAAEMGDRIKIIKIDVDRNIEVANRFDIRSVPTLMVFSSGKVHYKRAGVHNKSQLMQIIGDCLSSRPE